MLTAKCTISCFEIRWFLNATNISHKLIFFIFWFTLGLASASFRRTFDTEDDPDIEAEEATNLLDKSSTMSHQQPNLMTFEDFQRLPSDKQSEEIFKLLSMLSPFASEVSSLRSSMESALNRYLLFEISYSDEPKLNTKQSLLSKLSDLNKVVVVQN